MKGPQTPEAIFGGRWGIWLSDTGQAKGQQ
jgi:hypothetical protein